jgi:hypothetical protein
MGKKKRRCALNNRTLHVANLVVRIIRQVIIVILSRRCMQNINDSHTVDIENTTNQKAKIKHLVITNMNK